VNLTFLRVVACVLLACPSLPGSTSMGGSFSPPLFQKAIPVWLRGLEKEMNVLAGFRCSFDARPEQRVQVRVTGSTVYRMYLNGALAGYGPARAGHGFYRVDEWDITDHTEWPNFLAFEVAGYDSNSYAYLNQPSFLQVEVLVDGQVVASTGAAGEAGFEGTRLPYRVQKTQRISFQRPFSEAYKLAGDDFDWRTGGALTRHPLGAFWYKSVKERRAPYPRFKIIAPQRMIAKGAVRENMQRTDFWRDRSWTDIGPKLAGFKAEDLQVSTTLELQRLERQNLQVVDESAKSTITLEALQFRNLDFGRELTGFVGATITCTTHTRVFLSFDEILSDGDVNFLRLGMVNAIRLELAPGQHVFESIEPYSLRYLKVTATNAPIDVSDVHLRECANDDVWEAEFACSDPSLNRIFEAGRETYRQNAVDIFMDCPSRERAGWLCDSFFTARAGFRLSGNANVETDFLENFIRPAKFEHLPDGMLPMCYPADHNDGVFIPNWAMWFVLELEEHARRTGDREIADSAYPRVMDLLKYFGQFENEDGLLEKLQSWMFVEWSDSNKYLQDVSYATNMLYAGTLEAAGRLYDDEALTAKAEKLRQVIRERAFDGEFFVDNAVRKDGKLENTGNRTETCQYYAFFFDVATTQTHGALWNRLRDEFGPGRERATETQSIGKSNAFMGNVMRFELLSRMGESDRAIEDVRRYYYPMAEKTGTLWEHSDPSASCNHGFASHVTHLLYRDVLGAEYLPAEKRLVFRIPKSDLHFCQGRFPTPGGFVAASWRREEGKVLYRVEAPPGVEVQVHNASGARLVPEP